MDVVHTESDDTSSEAVPSTECFPLTKMMHSSFPLLPMNIFDTRGSHE